MQPESDVEHRSALPFSTKWDNNVRGNSVEERGDKGEDKRK